MRLLSWIFLFLLFIPQISFSKGPVDALVLLAKNVAFGRWAAAKFPTGKARMGHLDPRNLRGLEMLEADAFLSRILEARVIDSRVSQFSTDLIFDPFFHTRRFDRAVDGFGSFPGSEAGLDTSVQAIRRTDGTVEYLARVGADDIPLKGVQAVADETPILSRVVGLDDGLGVLGNRFSVFRGPESKGVLCLDEGGVHIFAPSGGGTRMRTRGVSMEIREGELIAIDSAPVEAAKQIDVVAVAQAERGLQVHLWREVEAGGMATRSPDVSRPISLADFQLEEGAVIFGFRVMRNPSERGYVVFDVATREGEIVTRSMSMSDLSPIRTGF